MYEFTYLLKFVNSESILAVLSCRVTRNVDMSTSLFLTEYMSFLLSFPHIQAASLLSHCHERDSIPLSPEVSIKEFPGKLFSVNPQYIRLQPQNYLPTILASFIQHLRLGNPPMWICQQHTLRTVSDCTPPIYTFQPIYSSIVFLCQSITHKLQDIQYDAVCEVICL